MGNSSDSLGRAPINFFWLLSARAVLPEEHEESCNPDCDIDCPFDLWPSPEEELDHVPISLEEVAETDQTPVESTNGDKNECGTTDGAAILHHRNRGRRYLRPSVSKTAGSTSPPPYDQPLPFRTEALKGGKMFR